MSTPPTLLVGHEGGGGSVGRASAAERGLRAKQSTVNTPHSHIRQHTDRKRFVNAHAHWLFPAHTHTHTQNLRRIHTD